MRNRQEIVKASYHMLVWIVAVIAFAVYIKVTGKTDDATFTAALGYSSEKSALVSLLPEVIFGLLLIGISALFKLNDMVKVCREEFVSIFYTWWSALCATMLFFAYYFYVRSAMGAMLNAVLVAAVGYATLLLAFVPFGRWISSDSTDMPGTDAPRSTKPS